MSCVNLLGYDDKESNLFTFLAYTKALTFQPQHHVVRNIDIQIHVNISFISNVYFQDSNVIFYFLNLNDKFKCNVFNDV